MRVLDKAIPLIQESLRPLSGTAADYNPLLELIGEARYVLLGEASHGTHEFYKARAEITKRLITEKKFTVVAWESDWPDALRVSRYVRGVGSDKSAMEALSGYKRFPTWMWRNADILELVSWLRNYNSHLPTGAPKVGVYGLDLYSLHASMEAVVRYLEETDPIAAQAARRRYACFDDFGDDPQAYGRTAGIHESLSCEDEVVRQLVELQKHAANFLNQNGRVAADELFFAEQNARVAVNAEHYYRAMYYGRPNTWNLRDTHMVDTLDELMGHLEEQGERPKAVIWAHNSHLGDARATQMGERGELNVGQLVRERHAREGFSVGFTTYTGTVTAASDWDSVAERKHVRPALEDSYEELFHEVGTSDFFLPLRGNKKLADEFKRERLERAIGVIYRPGTERWIHYFHANLSAQFDAVIHFDETSAVEPLERTPEWIRGELPELYPTGL